MANNDKSLFIEYEEIEEEINIQEGLLNVKLNDGQREAVKSILSNRVTLLSSKAGAGKTFITNIVMNILDKRFGYFDYSLCCFAGKGADNLSSGCGGRVAGTIHRTLGFSKGGFMYDSYNKLPSKVVIIDEVGMISSGLMCSLLKAIEDDAIVIMLGDGSQLASLSTGVMIRDIPLINENVNKIMLTDVVRQAKDSGILSMANYISDGVNHFKNEDNAVYGELEDFFVNIGDNYQNMIDDFIDNFDVDNRDESFIICTTNKMATKVNSDLQASLIEKEYLNGEEYIVIHKNKDGEETRIHKNDVVMIVSNNYDVLNVDTMEKDSMFNGNVGIVYDIYKDTNDFVVRVGDKMLLIDKDKFDSIKLGLSATCNKMQGSTLKRGYIYIENNWVNAELIGSRNWLYTALTRFKLTCKLYTDGYPILSKMVKKEATDEKRTFIEYLYS
ncbi:ATP-dependent DNA helicase [Clostridium sp.]|uniref:ATP-dependent DNA helicase n=1 Tax=Clostridium sp. TaxID=1506 RepID=UPI003F384D75